MARDCRMAEIYRIGSRARIAPSGDARVRIGQMLHHPRVVNKTSVAPVRIVQARRLSQSELMRKRKAAGM